MVDIFVTYFIFKDKTAPWRRVPVLFQFAASTKWENWQKWTHTAATWGQLTELPAWRWMCTSIISHNRSLFGPGNLHTNDPAVQSRAVPRAAHVVHKVIHAGESFRDRDKTETLGRWHWTCPPCPNKPAAAFQHLAEVECWKFQFDSVIPCESWESAADFENRTARTDRVTRTCTAMATIELWTQKISREWAFVWGRESILLKTLTCSCRKERRLFTCWTQKFLLIAPHSSAS